MVVFCLSMLGTLCNAPARYCSFSAPPMCQHCVSPLGIDAIACASFIPVEVGAPATVVVVETAMGFQIGLPV